MNFELLAPIVLESTDSTNMAAMRLLKDARPPEGTCIRAKHQTQGRGRRSNNWQSNKDENLLVSFILYPPSYLASQPFLLSKAIALATRNTLIAFTQENVEIKWPNDLLIGGKKAAGILIENQWLGAKWNAAVVGIGININQKSFEIEHATSLSVVNGKDTDAEAILTELQRNFRIMYEKLCSKGSEDILRGYQEALFGKKTFHSYIAAASTIRAKVIKVHESGHIELLTENGFTGLYDLNEVQLIY